MSEFSHMLIITRACIFNINTQSLIGFQIDAARTQTKKINICILFNSIIETFLENLDLLKQKKLTNKYDRNKLAKTIINFDVM